MMQRPIRSLAAIGACLALCVLGAPLAAGARDHDWRVSLSPAPGEVSLVQLAFPRARPAAVSAATLEVLAPPAFGSDYLASAALRPGLGTPGALILVANRPSALLDPARVELAVRARSGLGGATVLGAEDLLARTASPRPRLCDLALHGTALNASELSVLDGAGRGLAGIGGAEAIAEAYDIACGLPNPGKLRGALTLGGGAGGCEPCDPAPGYACPLAQAVEALCPGPVSSGLRAAGAGTN